MMNKGPGATRQTRTRDMTTATSPNAKVGVALESPSCLLVTWHMLSSHFPGTSIHVVHSSTV